MSGKQVVGTSTQTSTKTSTEADVKDYTSKYNISLQN